MNWEEMDLILLGRWEQLLLDPDWDRVRGYRPVPKEAGREAPGEQEEP